MSSSVEKIATKKSFASVQVRALGIGAWLEGEFADVWNKIAPDNAWQLVANIDDACNRLASEEEPPELIFLVQSFPGQYQQADVNRIQQFATLARIVLVVGTWSEGELRTGTPPSGLLRLYWYELQPWWQTAVRRRAAGLPPLWSSPLDHHYAGRWSSDANDRTTGSSMQSVLINAADYSVYETLASVLEEHGIDSTWSGRDKTARAPASAGIWDGGELSKRELAELTDFCQPINGPVVALLDFPRLEHIQQAQAAGATTILAKPYVVVELVAALTHSEEKNEVHPD